MDMAVCPVQKNVFFETAADFSGTDATYLIHRRLCRRLEGKRCVGCLTDDREGTSTNEPYHYCMGWLPTISRRPHRSRVGEHLDLTRGFFAVVSRYLCGSPVDPAHQLGGLWRDWCKIPNLHRDHSSSTSSFSDDWTPCVL